MRILVIALLKPSQIKYKIIPLSLANIVSEIFIIRKFAGPAIDKVRYFTLPALCRIKLFNLIVTPIILYFKIKKLKPDLLVSYHFIPHGFFAWLISSLTGVPFIYSQIDLDIQRLVMKPFLRRPILSILKKARYINVPGSKSKAFWFAMGLDPQKINILHSTIDTTNDFYPVETQKLYDFIYVGVLEERKGIHLMLKAISKLKNKGYTPSLLVVGDGVERKHLEHLSERLKIQNQVKFIGHSNRISNLVNKSRFYLLTSRNEGIPCAMMEAMACGVIPVSTDVADVGDIVLEGSTGFLIRDYKVESISNAMAHALESKDQFNYLGINARQIIIDEHSYTSATRRWEKILSSVSS
jgi:glycosyltransferase involved in cell wall biosynthesis